MIEVISFFIVWCVPGMIVAGVMARSSYKEFGYLTIGDIGLLGFAGCVLGWLWVPVGVLWWICDLSFWSKKIFVRNR